MAAGTEFCGPSPEAGSAGAVRDSNLSPAQLRRRPQPPCFSNSATGNCENRSSGETATESSSVVNTFLQVPPGRGRPKCLPNGSLSTRSGAAPLQSDFRRVGMQADCPCVRPVRPAADNDCPRRTVRDGRRADSAPCLSARVSADPSPSRQASASHPPTAARQHFCAVRIVDGRLLSGSTQAQIPQFSSLVEVWQTGSHKFDQSLRRELMRPGSTSGSTNFVRLSTNSVFSSARSTNPWIFAS